MARAWPVALALVLSAALAPACGGGARGPGRVGSGPGIPGRGRLAAQEVEPDEGRLLREAVAQEDAGRLAEAESLLIRVLEIRPGSVPALLGLERLLRVRRGLDTLVPRVRAALEADPESALLNQLLLRTLAALDRPDELESAARAWIAATPELEAPYREVAALWWARGDTARARAVLEGGRARIGRGDALALELGELYAAQGDEERAIEAWDRAIGPDAGGMVQVRRRIRARPDGGASVLAGLVDRLTAETTTPARREAAVWLAVDAGLEATARDVASTLLPERSPEDRSRFLSGLARRADGAGLRELAYWAYGELLTVEERLRVVGGPDRGRDGARAADVQERARLHAIRGRLAELAVAVGDTAAAARTLEGIGEGSDRRSPERRQAAAHAIELRAARDPDGAAAALRSFQADFPDAPERDALVAAVAGALVERDRRAEAGALLAGVRGPRTALVRARLSLAAGDREAARSAYLAAATGLRGAEATEALSLATLLGRLSDPAGVALGEALARRDRGDPGAAVDGLLARVGTLRAEDRPPLLELAAEMAADAGLDRDAREARRRIITEHPRSLEAPRSLLALARSARADAGGDAGGDAEARELLERLIVEYPRSALVPQARRELETLERRETVVHPERKGR